ncbi:MAG: hypothetical protein HXX10_14400 [Rhodoplanes sp.]|uniref:hypothetical protein n=1 Tax=Rhodoplanes sp. TaxID=1968906 RepID=UPI001830EC60|nr:hypothetical protein [Rhodoplanes sp.]NVO15222.1 hypothetical protein [Rhodoplanes sp.]
MTSQPHDAPAIDPDGIAETLCIGKFNVLLGPLTTITFTHTRAKVRPLFDHGMVDYESVVRARIVTSYDNMVALRDLLNQLIKSAESMPGQPSAATGPLN